MKKNLNRNLRLLNLSLLAISLLLSGCSEVKPWQKQYLAKEHMSFDPDPLEARSLRHLYESKEGSTGGYGVGGGGCGCS